jgi:membrane associated rhomboid family serine protease
MNEMTTYETPGRVGVRRFPIVTILLCLGAVVFRLMPDDGLWAALPRDPNASLLQLFFCHLVHWTTAHAWFDVLVLLISGAFLEMSFPKRFFVCLLVAMPLVPLAVFWAHPEVDSYAGASGLDTALVATLGVSLLVRHWRGMSPFAKGGICLFFVGLLSKILWELSMRDYVFVTDAGLAYEPVPMAHLCGLLIGIVVGWT